MTQERFRPNIPAQDLMPRQPAAETAVDPAPQADARAAPTTATQKDAPARAEKETEHGGPKGLDPTRFGDWERKGRCVDF